MHQAERGRLCMRRRNWRRSESWRRRGQVHVARSPLSPGQPPPSPSSSTRLALFAFALSSWVEGSAHIRAYALTPSTVSPPDADPTDSPDGVPLKDRLLLWLASPGAELADQERAVFGLVQLAVSNVRNAPLSYDELVYAGRSHHFARAACEASIAIAPNTASCYGPCACRTTRH